MTQAELDALFDEMEIHRSELFNDNSNFFANKGIMTLLFELYQRLTSVSNSSTSELISVSTTPIELTPQTGQQSITITNMSTGKVYYSHTSPVTTNHLGLAQNDRLALTNFAAPIHLVRASGTSTVQIDRYFRV